VRLVEAIAPPLSDARVAVLTRVCQDARARHRENAAEQSIADAQGLLDQGSPLDLSRLVHRWRAATHEHAPLCAQAEFFLGSIASYETRSADELARLWARKAVLYRARFLLASPASVLHLVQLRDASFLGRAGLPTLTPMLTGPYQALVLLLRAAGFLAPAQPLCRQSIEAGTSVLVATMEGELKRAELMRLAKEVMAAELAADPDLRRKKKCTAARACRWVIAALKPWGLKLHPCKLNSQPARCLACNDDLKEAGGARGPAAA
jgi:hypothetical protein